MFSFEKNDNFFWCALKLKMNTADQNGKSNKALHQEKIGMMEIEKQDARTGFVLLCSYFTYASFMLRGPVGTKGEGVNDDARSFNALFFHFFLKQR